MFTLCSSSDGAWKRRWPVRVEWPGCVAGRAFLVRCAGRRVSRGTRPESPIVCIMIAERKSHSPTNQKVAVFPEQRGLILYRNDGIGLIMPVRPSWCFQHSHHCNQADENDNSNSSKFCSKHISTSQSLRSLCSGLYHHFWSVLRMTQRVELIHPTQFRWYPSSIIAFPSPT